MRNSLSIVSSVLTLQARANADDENLQRHLQEASSRVSTIARAHEQLYKTNDVEHIEIGTYIKDVCANLPTNAETSIVVDAPVEVKLSTDRAISLALVVVELVTNATKYARSGAMTNIWVTLARQVDDLVVSVRDNGVGLPVDFAPEKSKGLGMRIVTTLAHSLDAELAFQRLDKGTSFELRIPIRKRPS